MASPSDPTAAYRAQQGLGPITQSADPTLVSWIKKAAAQTGADPNALLATAIQESGARLNGPAGDAGTSYGPFQFHRGGALGNHTPAWASTYAATFNRAQEFAKGQVHHGVGAAAVQRPQDRSLYARGVDSHMEQARRIIARNLKIAEKDAATKPHAPKIDSTSAQPTSSDAHDIAGGSLLNELMANPAQSALDSNAKLGGFKAPTLPMIQAAPTPVAPLSRKPKATALPAPLGNGKVFGGEAKIIGTPHAGTHNLGNWESDNAVDIAMPVGTPLRAVADGVIGSQIGSLGSSSSRFAGLRVHLTTAGDELYYAHLSKLTVKAGQRVKAGQIIGYSGSANGVSHLHLGSKNGTPERYA